MRIIQLLSFCHSSNERRANELVISCQVICKSQSVSSFAAAAKGRKYTIG